MPRIASLLPVLLSVVTAAGFTLVLVPDTYGLPDDGGDVAKVEGDREALRKQIGRTRTVDGESIVGEISQKSLSVKTQYGELQVPFDEILKVRFGLRLTDEQVKLFDESIRVIENEGAGTDPGKDARENLANLGMWAIPSLRKMSSKLEKDETKKIVNELINEIRPSDADAYLREDDEVVAERFTIRGWIPEQEFRIKALFGTLAIPSRDIREISFRQMELKKVWKIGAQHLERGAGLVTKINVKKGQKFSLVPSGTMSYRGKVFGPAGMSHWTWSGRNMGCLQWRIGNSAQWQILAAPFDGRAPAPGPLQFCVHLTGGAIAGEFTVTFKTSTR